MRCLLKVWQLLPLHLYHDCSNAVKACVCKLLFEFYMFLNMRVIATLLPPLMDQTFTKSSVHYTPGKFAQNTDYKASTIKEKSTTLIRQRLGGMYLLITVYTNSRDKNTQLIPPTRNPRWDHTLLLHHPVAGQCKISEGSK